MILALLSLALSNANFLYEFKFSGFQISNVRPCPRNVAKSLILSGIFFQLFPLVPSGSFFNNWMMIIFNLSIGFYFSTLKKR